MKLSTRLALGFGLLMTLLLGLLLVHLSAAHANAEASRRLAAVTSRLLLTSTDQRGWIDQMEESALKFRISGDSGYAEKFEEYAGRFDQAIDRVSTFELTDEERKHLEALGMTWSRMLEGGLRSRRLGPSGTDRDSVRIADVLTDRGVLADTAELEQQFDDLHRRTRALVSASLGAMQTQVQQAQDRTRRTQYLAWIGAVIALVVCAGVWSWVVRTIQGGLGMLTEGTRRVASGDFEHRLDLEGRDEFAQLSRDFNTMTKRLGEIDELKEKFVSRISHDLKSPLASMQEANNLLLDELVGPLTEDQRRILGMSRENGRQLHERITRLLEISRLEAGTAGMEFDTHDLARRVEDVAERLSASFVKCDCELELALPDGEAPCVCDGERFDQMLENLLENARRFAPEGTGVLVSLDVLDERPGAVPLDRWSDLDPAQEDTPVLRLSVCDEGPGVPDEAKEEIFTRFIQRSNGAGRRNGGGGSGLGLALCREVTKLHGGTMWVEDAPSGGARFVLLLPRRPAGVEEPPAPAPVRA